MLISSLICIEKYMLSDINFSNESMYFEELFSRV